MIADTLNSTNSIKPPSLYPERVLAVQATYSMDILAGKKLLSQVASDYILYYIEKYPKQNLNREFYLNLLENTYDNLKYIDKKISINLENTWKLERLPKLVLAILRVGGVEIIISKKPQVALIINDYLQISKSLNHEGEVGFINSILDKVRKEKELIVGLSKKEKERVKKKEEA